MIRSLHCNIRLRRGDASLAVTAASLERLFWEEGLDSLETALEQSLGAETEVYVLRDVRANASLNIRKSSGNIPGRQWGSQMARAVVKTIAMDSADHNNLRRFESQANYVACFLADLAQGTARQCWYYGIFTTYLEMEIEQAFTRLLHEHQAILGAVLANLYKQNTLDLCLRRLNAKTLHWLWEERVGRSSGAEGSETLLFEAALHLADRLGFSVLRSSRESLQSIYRASAPPTDWRDAAGLSRGVVNALSFLIRQGYLHPLSENERKQFTVQLDAALEGFDWLDVPALRSGLMRLLEPPRFNGLPLRPMPSGPTPRQIRLLEDLLAVLHSGEVKIEPGASDTSGNALRWYAALVNRAPGWTEDALAPRTIQQILDAWGGRSSEILELGAAGKAVLAALEDESPAVESIELECVGNFLLLRALLDVRLPGLALQTGYFSKGGALDLFLALSRCWSGLAADSADGYPDWIAALRVYDSTGSMHEPDVLAAQRFQQALLHVLQSQHLINPQVMHLYKIPWQGEQSALIAGDDSLGIWLLGELLSGSGTEQRFLKDWLDIWQPEIILADEQIDRSLFFDKLSHDEGMREKHRAGSARLQAATESLTIGLQNPDVCTVLTAATVLRAWARWLRGFSASSLPYLLENFIRRPGRLEHTPEVLRIVLEPRPMDIVLEISGYLDSIQKISWLGNRTLEFRIDKTL